MKKYVIFAVTFFILYLVFQMFSGYIMTFFYIPNLNDAWQQAGNLPSSISMKGKYSFISIFIALIAAILAYIITKRFVKKRS